MKRSLKISLKFGNRKKKYALDCLWQEYQQAVSDFLNRLLEKEKLTEGFLKSYDSPLSYRYKQCAKRQAMKLFKTWCRKKARKSKHTLRKPLLTLDQRFIEVQRSHNSFDFWIKIATLERGKPILVPAKSYAYLHRYLSDWELVPGGRLVKKNGQWFLTLTFQKEKPEVGKGRIKAVDLGYRKLAVTSDGEIFGKKLSELIEKGIRKKQFSKGYYRAKEEVKRYINYETKKLFHNTDVLVLESLKNLKRDKHGKWSRKVNRRFNFWTYSHALKHIKELGEVVGVQCHQVSPKGTSQTCPLCGYKEKLNRRGEYFKCLQCGFNHDADYVGALNILRRFTGELIVPQAIKPHLEYFSME